MSRPQIRIRKEAFGFTLAFADGEVDWYGEGVAPLLLRGASRSELEVHKIDHLDVGDDFHLSAPLIAFIELTHACNLQCKHCYISAGAQRPNELSTAEMMVVFDQLTAEGVLVAVILGGEPMMRPDFSQLVRHAHESGLVLSIGTNGTYVTQERIDELPREECFVSISLDGMEFQRELRGGAAFEDLRERLMLLKSNGIPTGIMCVITEKNLDEIERLLDFAVEHEFYFGSTPFSPLGRGRLCPELLPTPRLAAQAAELYKRDAAHEQHMMAKTGLCFTKVLQKCYILSKATRREFCGTALAYIQSDGVVYPCTTCSSMGRFRAGDIRKQSFKEIWENGFRELRAITWDRFSGCQSCELSKDPLFCTGRCPVMSEVYTSDPLRCGSTPYLRESLRLRTLT